MQRERERIQEERIQTLQGKKNAEMMLLKAQTEAEEIEWQHKGRERQMRERQDARKIGQEQDLETGRKRSHVNSITSGHSTESGVPTQPKHVESDS